MEITVKISDKLVSKAAKDAFVAYKNTMAKWFDDNELKDRLYAENDWDKTELAPEMKGQRVSAIRDTGKFLS